MVEPERFLHFTATGWTALGSMVGAVSIVVLSVFNFFYVRAASRQARAAHQTLNLLEKQLMMSERPFVAIHSEYNDTLGIVTVHAINQGSGPAIDVRAHLDFKPGAESGQVEYGVGCLATEESFLFLIGENSEKLTAATLRYKSLSGGNRRRSQGPDALEVPVTITMVKAVTTGE